MAFIEPTKEQIEAFSQLDHKGPIVMVNLLKFKGAEGLESYINYGAGSIKCVQQVGGKVLYMGDYLMPVIGDEDGKWDQVILVEYPSIQAFFDMVTSKEYLDILHYRTEALADSRLWATNPG